MMRRLAFALGGAACWSPLHCTLNSRLHRPHQRPSSQPQPTCSATRSACRSIPAPNGTFNPMSSNVKVYGAIYSAESCSYDPDRGVIVVPNRGVPQNVQANNAWISFLNHDGSVHTARWIGIANSGPQRANSTPPLVLNEPLGSDIVNGVLYLADRDGGTSPTDPSISVVRTFNMKTGMPGKEFRVEKSTGFNDLAIDKAGNIYGTVTGSGDGAQVWKITPDGAASIFVQNAPLVQPNGVAIDPQGNIVVVNIGNPDVITFSPDGKVVKTEKAAQAGNDGLVIMADGTKYVSSVRERRRVADPPESGGRTDRAERPERGVDVLRLAARISW